MHKVDLHVHTRFSNRSAEWLLRKLDFPDSYSDPLKLHSQLKERGMQYVTFTDHNKIDGCLAVSHLPDTFISVQTTTAFPDGCKVHLLIWNITEKQFKEIDDNRENIFGLQRLLQERGIIHAVAHPLYDLNQKLTAAHVEQLILLFKAFERINGYRDGLLGEAWGALAADLTPQKIAELADRHGIAPTHPEPWIKIDTAGSDDHGGIYAGTRWTEVAQSDDPADFLRRMMQGQSAVHGLGGTPVALSHSLYSTLYSFARDKFSKKIDNSGHLIEVMFSRFMEGKNPTEFTFGEKISFLAQGIVTGKIFELAKPSNATIWKELSDYFSQSDIKATLARETEGIEEPERRAFLIVNLFANQLAFRFFNRFIQQLSSGNLLESLQAISGLAPVMLFLGPYAYSFHSQAPSRSRLAAICRTIGGRTPNFLKNEKRAWFTDTLEDVNGVATTIRKMTAAGIAQGADLTVVTSRSEIQITDIPIKNFAPIGEFEIPEYELQKLSFPPILGIFDYIQRERFTEVIISTPGPIGMSALLAAKMLGIRTSGIYHTDFPQYVRILTDDSYLETLAWHYMHWFYNQLDLIFVNSEQYRKCWVDRGIDANKIAILPRGLDTELFHPSKREEAFWKDRGMREGEVGILYVGRISKEKDLDMLAEAYKRLQTEGLPVRLLMVGDGPYRKELEEMLPDAIFTGYLAGLELAKAYASADCFGFPSTTDTFGNVIIEAQATGLPVVVSDMGGPKELVSHGISGLITKALDVDDFTSAVRRLVTEPALRLSMRQAALDSVSDRNWSSAFRKFWAFDGSPSETPSAEPN